MAEAINIILSNDGYKEIFVEIKLDNGRSICIGEWLRDFDSDRTLSKIRITVDDIEARICDA